MPKSEVSIASVDKDMDAEQGHHETLHTGPPSPELGRTDTSKSLDDITVEATTRRRTRPRPPTERTGLLTDERRKRDYTNSAPESPKNVMTSRQMSSANSARESLRRHRSMSWRPSSSWVYSGPIASIASLSRAGGLRTPKVRHPGDADVNERVWYDQFTSTDWVHDSIADGYRVLRLRRLQGWRGRLHVLLDSAQGWLLVAIIGTITAYVAYFVDISESALFDIKRGYCQDRWFLSHSQCCLGPTSCARWRTWSEAIRPSGVGSVAVDYIAFVCWCLILSAASCFITLRSRTVVPSHIASTFDENLGATRNVASPDGQGASNNVRALTGEDVLPPSIYYSAAGSGVAEVKVILSGFVLHGYLGLRTLSLKVLGLILSVASGMSLGKEGPFVHIATCIGNISCRMFSKYTLNDGKRREVLVASASGGVAVAFGSPLGGVLFGLEEVSYYFPPKTLFRTFFCCIVAAMGLKFLNPYGTEKIVLFQVRYVTDWRAFELFWFAFLGFAGGLAGALFIKASRFWATTFRRLPVVKAYPMLEVLLVALLTGLLSFWNRHTRLAVAELLAEITSPCANNPIAGRSGLCPAAEDIPSVIWYLLMAFLIKAFLTIVTFGIKVPAGIYVPSMVCGGLLGRIVGHFVQWLVYKFPNSWAFGYCSNSSSSNIEECVTPGVYALVAAGATMCGVTRLSVTLAVILFELTGSLDHVLPFSLAILCAKWTADAVEPLSIYDLLTDMNSYPFIDNKSAPVFDSELGDLVPHHRPERTIDITLSPYVKASALRTKLKQLQTAGELDGGLPLVRNKVLVGLLPAPDLEFALDKITTSEDSTLCLMSNNYDSLRWNRGWRNFDDEMGDILSESREDLLDHDEDNNDDDDDETERPEPADLTAYIDPAPVALDFHSPMDLVYQCFVKLGLRYICVVSGGEYQGMVHKKSFVRYVKTAEAPKT